MYLSIQEDKLSAATNQLFAVALSSVLDIFSTNLDLRLNSLFCLLRRGGMNGTE